MAEVDRLKVEDERSVWERAREALRWLGLHEALVLLILLVLIGGSWGFLMLADEVSEEDQAIAQLDERLLLALREPDDLSDPIGPDVLEEVVRDVTALGGGTVLLFVTISTAVFLGLRGNRRLMVILLVSVIGAFLFSELFKVVIARPRPVLVPAETYVRNFSFPSGHSLAAAATYLTLGILLGLSQSRLWQKAYFIILALLLTVAVGFSRVYLGVHWPSDVLGGWTVGIVWALLVWLVARWLRY